MELTSSGDLVMYRYKVEISLNQLNGRAIKTRDKKRIIQLLLEANFGQAGANIVTDFAANLITTKKLNLPSQRFKVQFRAEDEDTPGPKAGRYYVDLILEDNFTVSQLIDHLTSSNTNTMISNREAIIQALNIIVGHNLKAPAHIASLGANRHHDWSAPAPAERISLGTGLLAIRGFFLSVRAATARVLLNVQVKHSPFYETGSLDRLMTLFIQSNGPNKFRLAKYIEGVSVNIIHIANRNRAGQQIKRMKTIWGLATQTDGERLARRPRVHSYGAGPKDVQFWVESTGKYVSVFDHFQQTYNITITDTKLPVVNVGNKANPSYLPAQVCQIEPGEPFRAELLPAQTQSMIRFAVRKPAMNAHSITNEGVTLLNLNQGLNPTHVSISSWKAPLQS